MICNLDLADLVLSCNAFGSMTLTFVRCYSNSRFHGYASIIAKILFCIVKDFYFWNKTACYVTQKKTRIKRHLLLLTQFYTNYTTLEHRGVVVSADVPSNCRGEGESPFPQRVKIKIVWPLRLYFGYIFQVKCNQSQTHGPKSGIVMIPLSGLDSSAETNYCYEISSRICNKFFCCSIFLFLIDEKSMLSNYETKTPRVHYY